MNNRTISVIMSFAVALLLSGCGGDDDSGSLEEYLSKNSAKITLNSTLPEHMEDNAAVDDPIYIFFDTALATSTPPDAFVLKRMDNNEAVPASADIRGATFILKPEANLDYSTEYYVENASTIENIMGNELENDVFVKFTTEVIDNPPAQPSYSPEDGENIAPGGEIYLPVTEERAALHAENHSYFPAVTATLPAIFEAPVLASIEDNLIHREEMVAVNPAPNEYLWIMEGKRHGFSELTVVLTNTIPGNGAPLHTHVGEEAHILLEGSMYYQLGDEKTIAQAPYILNIPSMVPHGFINVGKEPAKLVGVFPDTNHWEYDVLDFDIFADFFQSQSLHDVSEEPAAWLQDWYSEENRKARLEMLEKQHPGFE